MDIYRFLLLTRKQRAELLFEQSHLAKRAEAGSEITLYQLGNFYVEVHLDTSNDTIERVIPFKCVDLLEPYLSEICYADIEYLL